MKKTSFEKGEIFEKFVEDELFQERDYILVHRTNSHIQNATRYAEDTLKPDLKFRCKHTEKEFYIEAKFRSKFNYQGMIKIMPKAQYLRFKELEQSEQTKIFICIGYEATPDSPDFLSIIPLSALTSLSVDRAFLKKFYVDRAQVQPFTLELSVPLPNSQKKTSTPKIKPNKTKAPSRKRKATPPPISKPVYYEEAYTSRSKTSSTSSYSLLIIAIMFLLGGGYYYFNIRTDYETVMKEKVADYYETIAAGQIQYLGQYIAPNVKRLYDKPSLTIRDIKQDILRYQRANPNTATDVLWSTFKHTIINEKHYVSYQISHKIIGKKSKVHRLQINTVWNKDLKLISINEKDL